MDRKKFVQKLGFQPKDNTVGIYEKKYQQHSYSIEVDFSKEQICYGHLIGAGCKTTQNFSQEENWVVLECVDRLLEKGYNPKNIVLEKIYPSGHGHSGRLDILVTKNSKAFLMIECKTWGKEFEKEFNNLQKNGGQLLTYFQNDKDSEYLMLYTSRLNKDKIEYQNEIINIEEYYRQAGNIADTFERWNKQTYSNGIFDNWVNPYCYKNKPLTKADLLELTEENSGKIFHGFLSILRKHSVSDKPNAFNKIFNLFLAKIYDEKKRDNDILDFQWLEDVDNPVDFQVRLYNLHKAGLYEFLKKEIEGISDDDFKYENEEELLEKKKKLLKFNKVFDIKDVIDDESFDDNFKVLKEIVQLLEKYQIRYPRKQQHLSDFFERLLTTGLKQEAGQFFTPPPITKFITKSLPLDKVLSEYINQPIPKLPAVIDYAAGSGHFITEIMEAYQDCINGIDTTNYYPEATKTVDKWKLDPYSWAGKYVYGIEKDYRLVKVAKVGCYFYGDGLAQIIHGDGLDSFKYSKSYVGLLSENTKIEDSQKAKFSIVVSNPPYSVDAFKGYIKNIKVNEEFELYKYLTDRSSEIECLFVERTKQLLKDDGIAGIVLPSSILTNSGIYTRTREIILKYFEIVAITELGSKTFMATGTNTVVLFLRRRNNYECVNLEKAVDKFLTNHTDITINGIETPISKYVNYVWENLNFEDYVTLLEQKPNDKVKNHDLYKEYSQKITSKSDKEFWNKVIAAEKEKLYYFILAYPQKLVVVKTGENDAEKQFLGYEFSNRRGSEGIHAIQRGKSIDDCTKLFDINSFDNPKKASTYIYKAFKNEEIEVDETLRDNITRVNLLDMMTFDRVDFEKVINTKAKKKVKIESKWKEVNLKDILSTVETGSRPQGGVKNNTSGILSLGGEHIHNTNGCIDLSSPKFVSEDFYKNAKTGIVKKDDILLCKDGALTGKIAIVKNELNNRNAMINEHVYILRCDKLTTQKYVFNVLYSNMGQELLTSKITGTAQGGLNSTNLKSIQIPLPPLDIQQKIVDEMAKIELQINKVNQRISNLKTEIKNILNNIHGDVKKLEQVCESYIGLTYKPECIDSNGVLVLRSSNIKNGKLDVSDQVRVNCKIRENLFVKKGDVLVCVRNGSKKLLGKSAYIENLAEPMTFGAFMAICRSDIGKYIYLWMQSDNYSQQIAKLGTTMSINQLTQKMLMNLEIPIPDITSQKKIVTQIEELEKQIKEAQAIIDNSKQQKQTILDKYLK